MTETINTGKILPVNLEDEMKNSYIDYAMSVIVMRALPGHDMRFFPYLVLIVFTHNSDNFLTRS